MGSVWRERLHEWSCRNMSNDQEIVTSKPLKPWVSFWIDCLIFFAFTDLLVFPWNRKGRTELGDVTPHNIKQLKKLNSVVFPVSYNDKVKIKLSIVCWEKIRKIVLDMLIVHLLKRHRISFDGTKIWYISCDNLELTHVHRQPTFHFQDVITLPSSC